MPPPSRHSQFSLSQVNAERAAACDAATALLRLCSLAAGSGTATGTSAGLLAVEQAQELAWLLCDALGSAQALMERHGRFVQVGYFINCSCIICVFSCLMAAPRPLGTGGLLAWLAQLVRQCWW